VKQHPPLALRPVTADDAYALWLWRNDPEVRRVSFEHAPIAWPEHVAWLQARLGDGAAVVLLAEISAARPVGSIRFDTRDGWRTARLSFVLAPEARGQGLGRPLVSDGVQYLRETHRGVSVHADVQDLNERSLRIFRGLGWTDHASRDGVVRFWSPDGTRTGMGASGA
jgi:RimJ/RimL family protein N-acetyltransferase